jgi:hypothetical protein
VKQSTVKTNKCIVIRTYLSVIEKSLTWFSLLRAHSADSCFLEFGIEPFDYTTFEEVLSAILQEIGYPEEQVVRWEMTGQEDLKRAGAIEHFWESQPGIRRHPEGKFFVSTWMYMDTNGDQDAYNVYTKAKLNFELQDGVLPTAIIAGTFELNDDFWFKRNVLGRLLAVAIGASNQTFDERPWVLEQAVTSQWREYCDLLGFGDVICDTDGLPVIATHIYHAEWTTAWDQWKSDICERLTNTTPYRAFNRVDHYQKEYIARGNEIFWKSFPIKVNSKLVAPERMPTLPDDLTHLVKHRVPHTGVILDAVASMPTIGRLHSIIRNYIAKMGFNTVQLRLNNNNGFLVNFGWFDKLGNSLISGGDNPLYTLSDLLKLAEGARNDGVEIIPEISVSTNAAGWVSSGFLAECPDHFCMGLGTPININDERFLPLLYSIVFFLRNIFKSKFVHLGTDEREAASPCFREAGIKTDFNSYEHKLEALMTLADLTSDDIIRSDNTEGVRYAERTGNVTQYPAGVYKKRQGEKFFLTIDIFSGDAFSVFSKARAATNLGALGVLAELRKLNESKWTLWEIPKRLLAFAMGVSELGSARNIRDADMFAAYFTRICGELGLSTNCTPPGEFEQRITVITESREFAKKACEVRTSIRDKKVSRAVEPYFRVNAAGAVQI